MYPAYKKNILFSSLLLTLTILATACNMPRTLGGPTPIPTIDLAPTVVSDDPPVVVGEFEGVVHDWYVATDGSDLNNCRPAPCATLGRALSLALSVTDPEGRQRHVFHIAAGTYTLDDSVYRQLDGHVTIIGAGADATIIDRMVDGSVEGGFAINSNQRVVIEDLTLRNARDCIHIHDTSTAEIQINNVNLVDCIGNGVENRGTGLVELFNVNISGAHGLGFGPAESTWHEHGILNFGEVRVEGGEITAHDKTGVFNFGNINLTGTTITLNQREGLDNQMGVMQLSFVLVYQNGQAPGPINGINTHSTLWVDNSRIAENGAGIHISPGGSLLMTDSIIRDHAGKALSVQSGTIAEIRDSLIENNASDDLTAIANEGELLLLHSDVRGNHSNAIYSLGSSSIVTIEFSNITNTMFAPSTPTQSSLPTIYMEDPGSLLNISNSLIAHNLVENFIPAIESSGEAHILNSTISINSGLGVYLWGTGTISYSTIAENGASGLLTSGINVDNTIIARNSPSDCINLLSLDGSTTSGVNIDTDSSCGVEQTHAPAVIYLGPLADNGGPTHTHPLLPQSPAIDAATGSCPPVDQRDFGRPIGAGCDVGAYETGAAASTESEESEEEPGSATTITVLIPDTPCYTGPGPEWGFVNNFSVGTHMELVGAGFTGDGNQAWVVGTHPTADNVNCWLPGDNVTTGIPLGEMRLITIPARPTPTPLPTPDETREPAKEPTPCPLDGNGIPKC